MSRGRRIRGFVLRLCAVCLISVIALAVCFEIYLRHAGYLKVQPAPYPCIMGDPVFNHTFYPDCKSVATAAALRSAHDANYETNSRGYRGHLPEPGKKTLVVIGDSYTEGFGLNEPDTFPAQLENAIRGLGGKNWQVLNGGTVGFSPALYPAYFERRFLTASPALVVLNLDASDFNDDGYFLEIAEYDSVGDPATFPGREALPQWMMPYIYGNSSAVVRFLHQEINQYANVQRRRNFQWQMDRWVQRDPKLIPDAELAAVGLAGCQKNVEAVAKNVIRLRDRVMAVGSRMAIHMYPPGGSVKSYAALPPNISFVQSWDQKTRTDFTWACGINEKVVGLFRNLAQKQGILFYDSYPVVLPRADRAELYYDLDAHWNEKGVKVVTDALAHQLMPELRKMK